MSNMPNYKKSYALRVDEKNFHKIKIIAERNRRSLNSQIEYLIENCIIEHEKENGVIKLPDFGR